MTNPTPNNPFSRRSFLRRAGFAAAAAPLAATMLSNSAKGETVTDTDLRVLALALNLEYLEAEYYNRGVSGTGLDSTDTSGGGTPGDTIVKSGSTKVNFTDPVLASIAAEIAADESIHVRFLRDTLEALGYIPPAKPAINLLNSFNMISKAAGLGDFFDPYANEINFYIGAFSLTDVGVTAYEGGVAMFSQSSLTRSAAGILACESFHIGAIRTSLYRADLENPNLGIANTTLKISDLRDSLDGGGGKDQPLVNQDGSANIAVTDAQGRAFGRGARKVENIVYGQHAASKGLLFPNGINFAVEVNS